MKYLCEFRVVSSIVSQPTPEQTNTDLFTASYYYCSDFPFLHFPVSILLILHQPGKEYHEE